jgi:hypothetical protein
MSVRACARARVCSEYRKPGVHKIVIVSSGYDGYASKRTVMQEMKTVCVCVSCSCTFHGLMKVKVKLSLRFLLTEHLAMKAFCGSGGIAPRTGRFTPKERAAGTP